MRFTNFYPYLIVLSLNYTICIEGMMIIPQFHITLQIQSHYKVIFSLLHDALRRQPPAHLSVIPRYEAASLDVWFPTFRGKVVFFLAFKGRNIREECNAA